MKTESEIEEALHKLQREEDEIREKKRALHQELTNVRAKEQIDAVVAQIPAESVTVLVEALRVKGEVKD